MAQALPSRAQVVVIGGGVIGTSVAYHLTALGWTDVLLLEQGQLSCGTTWHAAGLVGQLRATEAGTRLVQYSAALYEQLEAETGQATGFRRCGGLTVARTPERMMTLRRTAATAAAYQIECELISPAEAAARYPLLNAADLAGAIWLPADGRANPVDLTAALARGARLRGATIRERVRVTGILQHGGRVRGVRTDSGDVEAEVVVNCAGQWAKQVGALAGVTVPLHSAEHFYVVTDQIDGVHPDLPVLRDPDGYTYFKEEVGGLVVGGFEPTAKPWVSPDELPYPFEFQLLDEDWDHFAVLMDSALHRIPVLAQTGIRKFYNGPESFTPDNQFILGQAPELAGFYVGAGFNSVGIASAGGAGLALAQWIIDGEPDTDLTAVDIRRFAPFNGNSRWLRDRVGRGARPALRDRLAEPGARDGAPVPPLACLPGAGGRERLLRLEDGLGTAQLLRARRAAAGHRVLLGQAELAALVVRRAGGDAAAGRGVRPDVVLQVPGHWSGRRGRAPVAVHQRRGGGARPNRLYRHAQRPRHLRVGHHRDQVVGDRVPAGRERRDDRARRRSHPPAHAAGCQASLVDVTSAYAVYGVMGPASRQLLSRLTAADLSEDGFGSGPAG